MKISRLRLLKSLYFSARDVARAFALSEGAARLTCHRYAKEGLFIRLIRDVYVLSENWSHAKAMDFYILANRIQVPSYISFTTALAFYEITTQVQQNYIESVSQVRTKNVKVMKTEFQYMKIQRGLYWGYVKKNDCFIALPEKAMLDALYLMCLGRYRLDLGSIDLSKLDQRKLNRLLKRYPVNYQSRMRVLWKR